MHRSTHRLRLLGAALAAVALPLALVACGDDSSESADPTTTADSGDTVGTPTVTDVWARPGTTGGNSAIYMVIDGGDEDTELVGVAVDEGVADSVELHETTTEGGSTEGDPTGSTTTMGEMSADSMEGETTTTMGGMMSMQPVESIPVPAGEKVTLEPGGYHVMLLGLQEDLVAGDELPVTLTFEPGGTVEVTAEVREP